MDDKVKYWIDLSDYDLDTALAMLESRRYLYVGFMCHQTIDQIEPLNIETRYPSYKERLLKSMNEQKGREILNETKQLQEWIKTKL